MIKQTAEIFELLSKGGFISSDSTDPHIRQLYNQIDGNLTELYEHYASINFFLESGNEYYYFARRETRAELERILYNKEYRQRMLEGYEYMASRLGDAGAPKHAAQEMIRLLHLHYCSGS